MIIHAALIWTFTVSQDFLFFCIHRKASPIRSFDLQNRIVMHPERRKASGMCARNQKEYNGCSFR
jgi:hypothetical protein